MSKKKFGPKKQILGSAASVGTVSGMELLTGLVEGQFCNYGHDDLEGRISPKVVEEYILNNGRIEEVIRIGQENRMHWQNIPYPDLIGLDKGHVESSIAVTLFYSAFPWQYFETLTQEIHSGNTPGYYSDLFYFALSHMGNDPKSYAAGLQRLTHPMIEERGVFNEEALEPLLIKIGQNKHSVIALNNALVGKNEAAVELADRVLRVYFKEGITEDSATRLIATLDSENNYFLMKLLEETYSPVLLGPIFQKLMVPGQKRYNSLIHLLEIYAKTDPLNVATKLWTSFMLCPDDKAAKAMLGIFGYVDKDNVILAFSNKSSKFADAKKYPKYNDRIELFYKVYPRAVYTLPEKILS